MPFFPFFGHSYLYYNSEHRFCQVLTEKYLYSQSRILLFLLIVILLIYVKIFKKMNIIEYYSFL